MFETEAIMHVALTAMYASIDGGNVADAEARLLKWADAQEDPRMAMLKLILAYQGMTETMLIESYGSREAAEALVRQQLEFLNAGGTIEDIQQILGEEDE